MPVMNGFEASKKINEMVSKNQIPDVVIIALTANIATIEEDDCLDAGMKYFLSKPASFAEFSKTIENIFNKKNEEDCYRMEQHVSSWF